MEALHWWSPCFTYLKKGNDCHTINMEAKLVGRQETNQLELITFLWWSTMSYILAAEVLYQQKKNNLQTRDHLEKTHNTRISCERCICHLYPIEARECRRLFSCNYLVYWRIFKWEAFFFQRISQGYDLIEGIKLVFKSIPRSKRKSSIKGPAVLHVKEVSKENART